MFFLFFFLWLPGAFLWCWYSGVLLRLKEKRVMSNEAVHLSVSPAPLSLSGYCQASQWLCWCLRAIETCWTVAFTCSNTPHLWPLTLFLFHPSAAVSPTLAPPHPPPPHNISLFFFFRDRPSSLCQLEDVGGEREREQDLSESFILTHIDICHRVGAVLLVPEEGWEHKRASKPTGQRLRTLVPRADCME